MTGCQGVGWRCGHVQVGDRGQRAQVEHARDLVDVRWLEAEALLEQRARGQRHRALDLEPHDLAEAPLAQLLLDGQQQVVRLVLLDREVGVAGHPEQVVVEDLHAREEDVQVGGDDLLQQHVGAGAHLPQARQHRRHLDAREAVARPSSGSRTVTASDSDRSLMYGNGCDGSTASGVSTGKISSRNRWRSSSWRSGRSS